MNTQLIYDVFIEIAEDHEEYVQSSDIAAMQSEYSCHHWYHSTAADSPTFTSFTCRVVNYALRVFFAPSPTFTVEGRFCQQCPSSTSLFAVHTKLPPPLLSPSSDNDDDLCNVVLARDIHRTKRYKNDENT